MTPEEQKNLQVISRFLDEVWNQGKAETIDELYHQGGTADGLGEQYREGTAQFKLFHQLVMGTCTDIHIETKELLAGGDKVSFLAEMTGKHKATGKPLQFQGGGFARIANGKIAEAQNAWNFLDMLIQLEAVPADILPRALMGTIPSSQTQ